MKKWQRERQHNWLVALLVLVGLAVQISAGFSHAYAQAAVLVTLQLRGSSGQEMDGVEITLLRPPENEYVNSCTTAETGRCQVALSRGIYGVRVAHSELSAWNRLAVAEGGLGDLGITVGEEAITYALVIAADGFLYFDATPNADRPEPIIPTEEMVLVHWHLLPTPTQPSAEAAGMAPTGMAIHMATPFTEEGNGVKVSPAESAGTRPDDPQSHHSKWPFTVGETTMFLGAGALLGSTFALVQRRRQKKEVASGRTPQ